MAGAMTICVALSLLVAGCSRFPSCLPAPMSVTPNVAHPGDTVTVSAVPADCALGYGTNKSYKLTLRSDILTPAPKDSASNRTYSVETSVASDGSFTTDIVIPESFPLARLQYGPKALPGTSVARLNSAPATP